MTGEQPEIPAVAFGDAGSRERAPAAGMDRDRGSMSGAIGVQFETGEIGADLVEHSAVRGRGADEAYPFRRAFGERTCCIGRSLGIAMDHEMRISPRCQRLAGAGVMIGQITPQIAETAGEISFGRQIIGVALAQQGVALQLVYQPVGSDAHWIGQAAEQLLAGDAARHPIEQRTHQIIGALAAEHDRSLAAAEHHAVLEPREEHAGLERDDAAGHLSSGPGAAWW